MVKLIQLTFMFNIKLNRSTTNKLLNIFLRFEKAVTIDEKLFISYLLKNKFEIITFNSNLYKYLFEKPKV